MLETSRPIMLIGGGGHCKSVIDAIESTGRKIAGILDLPGRIGENVLGYDVVGTDEQIGKWVNETDFIVCIGHIQPKEVQLRRQLHEKIKSFGGRLATVIASTARVSPHAVIGEGTVVLHHAVINAASTIGTGCIINTAANIEHDATIEDYCHISTGAMINGQCTVGAETFVGSGTVMVNGTAIAPGCVIGAGSVVRKTLRIKGVYAGNPALLKIKL